VGYRMRRAADQRITKTARAAPRFRETVHAVLRGDRSSAIR
jgi:hypothetical protein